MSVICQIDQTVHESREILHAHLRRLKVKQADYYIRHEPRVCKGTGKPIPFKDWIQYLSQDFIDKNAIKAYLKREPVAGREWAIEWLRRRKEEKGLVYAPSQVELRSLQCPSMAYYNHVGDYYEIARELGFKERYVSYTEQNPAIAADLGDKCIICDTREQSVLQFPVTTIRAKLDEGDYALAAPHDKGIYIERKSVSDMVGTLNLRQNKRKKVDDSISIDVGFERFDRELARAAEKGHYIVMVVETPLTQALSFSYLPQMRWSKVSESHVFFNLRELLTKYPLSFQAVFADGRADAANKVMRILQLGDEVRRIDLEYANERGLL
jgi:hypothetical protein